MEPITAAVVAAVTLAASTHRPKFEEYLRPEQPPTVMVVPKREFTATPLIDRRTTGAVAVQALNTPKDQLHQELMTFMPQPGQDPLAEPVSRIDEVVAANEFLRKLPGSIALPTLQRNDAGDIGMYWDNDVFYIDVDIDSSSTVSVYARELASDQQYFVEDVSIEQIDAAWFEEFIGEKLKPVGAIV